MWDAEWNAGGGVHESAAMEWVDLSGNGLTMHSNGTPVFYSNYIAPTKLSEMFHTDETSLMDDVLANGLFTIEAVAEANTINNPKILQFGGNDQIHISLANADPTRVGVSAKFGSGNSSTYSSFPKFANVSGVCNGSTVTGRYNSLAGSTHLVAPSRAFSLPVGVNTKRFAIGYRYTYDPDSPMVDGTKVFSLRCYNRALTTEELDLNLAIDKQRFNIS